jgi:hypothetical protein
MRVLAAAALALSGCYLSHELAPAVGAPAACGAPECRDGTAELRVRVVEGTLDPGRYPNAALVDVAALPGGARFVLDVFVAIHLERRVVIDVSGIDVPVGEIAWRGPVDFSWRDRALVIDRVVCADCARTHHLLFAAVSGSIAEGFDAPLAGVSVDEGSVVCSGRNDIGEWSERRALLVRDEASGEEIEVDVRDRVAGLGAGPLRVDVVGAGVTCSSPDLPASPSEGTAWVAWSLAR